MWGKIRVSGLLEVFYICMFLQNKTQKCKLRFFESYMAFSEIVFFRFCYFEFEKCVHVLCFMFNVYAFQGCLHSSGVCIPVVFNEKHWSTKNIAPRKTLLHEKRCSPWELFIILLFCGYYQMRKLLKDECFPNNIPCWMNTPCCLGFMRNRIVRRKSKTTQLNLRSASIQTTRNVYHETWQQGMRIAEIARCVSKISFFEWAKSMLSLIRRL